MQENQDKDTSTDEVQSRREYKNFQQLWTWTCEGRARFLGVDKRYV